MKPLNLQWKVFGRLSVIEKAAPKPDGAIWWRCACMCGNEKIARGSDLKRGFIQSCGCWNSEVTTNRNYRHGGAGTRLYRIWQAMHDRTGNPRASRYAYYGGRGIVVCEGWVQFEPFRNWSLANGYASNLSIDRIDNNGNYEPINCRWTTQQEQVRNRRSKVEVQHQGECR